MNQREMFAWVEKYRPQTVAECILPSAVRAAFEGMLKQKDMPHLLMCGRAGTGKTTVAKALARQLDMDVMVVNGSDTGGHIDTLRTTIRDFASCMTLNGNRKMVVLDEADYLTQATQPALRAFMEEFTRTTCFVLTCNYPAKLIDPLKSRCSVIEFKVPAKERVAIASEFAQRACDILTAEHVTFNKAVVQQTVVMFFPDFRRALNELQRFSASGELSEGILSQLSDKDVADLFDTLKAKDYNRARKWIISHDMDESSFYSMLFEHTHKYVHAESLNDMTCMMADYSYRAGFCADKVLNALACLVDLMSVARFK